MQLFRLSTMSSAIACAVVATWVAGCATERLDAAAPGGVNLTGEWKFNPNLSDDPDKLPDPEKGPLSSPGGHRRHGGGRGGGGMPPSGMPMGDAPGDGGYNFMPMALTVKAPALMSIIQKDATVVVKIETPDGARTADEYTAGTRTTVPYGKDGTAERIVGWRGPVFVVTNNVKKGGWREDDFALDEDGRLIVTTQTRGGHMGKLEIKRVYDRVRNSTAATPSETGTPRPARLQAALRARQA